MIDIKTLSVSELLDLKRQVDEFFSSARPVNVRAGQTNRKSRDWREVSKTWDFTKSNSELSSEHGATINTVYLYRKRYGHPNVLLEKKEKVVIVRPPRKTVDWASLDWNKRDADLAVQTGKSREMVRQKRAQLGHPKLLSKSLKKLAFITAYKDAEVIDGKEAMKAIGACKASIFGWAAEFGKKVWFGQEPHKNQIYPWSQINWDLPTTLIARIWGINAASVGVHRYNRILGKAKWRCNNDNDLRHQDLIEAEKQKAEAWRASKRVEQSNLEKAQ